MYAGRILIFRSCPRNRSSSRRGFRHEDEIYSARRVEYATRFSCFFPSNPHSNFDQLHKPVSRSCLTQCYLCLPVARLVYITSMYAPQTQTDYTLLLQETSTGRRRPLKNRGSNQLSIHANRRDACLLQQTLVLRARKCMGT